MFNSDKSSEYKPYYKPKAPPGGKTSICFGGPTEPTTNKQNANQNSDRSTKSNSSNSSGTATAKPNENSNSVVSSRPARYGPPKSTIDLFGGYGTSPSNSSNKENLNKKNANTAEGNSIKVAENTKKVSNDDVKSGGTQRSMILPKNNDVFGNNEQSTVQSNKPSNRSGIRVNTKNPPGGKSQITF